MRSPLGPALIITGFATILVLVLVLFQAIGLRDDLDRIDERLATIGEEIEVQEPGIARGELQRTLNDLESRLRAWMRENVVGSGAAPQASGSGGVTDEVLGRLDEVLQQLEALDGRLDRICEGVPVC